MHMTIYGIDLKNSKTLIFIRDASINYIKST